MKTEQEQLKEMVLYAWVGLDELGSGEMGLKQASVPAGTIPMVATKRDKMDRDYIQDQLAAQSQRYGKTIRLVRFVYSAVVVELPNPNPR